MRNTFRVFSRALLVLGLSILAPELFAVSPRITFVRTVSATHSLGKAEDVAIVQAIGDHASIEIFVGVMKDELTHSGFFRAHDLRQGTGAADAYLAIKNYKCEAIERSGEGSTRDVDGNRVKRNQHWIDVTCTARIDVLSNVMKYQSTFYAKGEGTSPRAETLTNAEREIAYAQAARYAALSASEKITPRKVRETIALDETAPAFEEGYAMINADQLSEARKIWEKAMVAQPRSAPLRYNLGAVCEAMGDRRAAAAHYGAAQQLAPTESRYSSEMKLFSKRH